MKNNVQRHFLTENRGKYIDISFFAAIFSGLLISCYTFLFDIFTKSPVIQTSSKTSFLPLTLSGILLMHTSFAFILGLILGYNKKINFNLFIAISIIVGTLLDFALQIHRGSIFSILIIALVWFVFAIVFLVFEKIFNDKTIGK